jgi:hypothetical protein
MADRWAREWVRKGRQEKVAEIEEGGLARHGTSVTRGSGHLKKIGERETPEWGQRPRS